MKENSESRKRMDIYINHTKNSEDGELDIFQKFLDFEYQKYLKLYCKTIMEKNNNSKPEELVRYIYNDILKNIKCDYNYSKKNSKNRSDIVNQNNNVKYDFDIGDGKKRYAMYHTNDKRIALLYGKSLSKGIAELVVDIFNQLNRYGYQFKAEVKNNSIYTWNIVQVNSKKYEFDASGVLSNYYSEKINLKRRKQSSVKIKDTKTSKKSISSLMVLSNLAKISDDGLIINKRDKYLQIIVRKRKSRTRK